MIILYDPSYQETALRLGRMMHEESRFRGYDFNERKILHLLNNPNTYTAFSVVEGKIVGFFLGIVQEMWFSAEKYGFDLALYILPEHRGGTYAVRLIRSFEAFCRARGCVEINLSSSAEISTEIAYGLYRRLGYDDCGFISRKGI